MKKAIHKREEKRLVQHIVISHDDGDCSDFPVYSMYNTPLENYLKLDQLARGHI